MKEYLIGDRIKWITGNNILSRGIVREDLRDEVEVVCYEISNQPTRKKLIINKSLIDEDRED
jgi:hypothetical protein